MLLAELDLSALLGQIMQGNNPILLLIVLFLFKDQLLALLTPKPKPVEPSPVPAPSPAPSPVITVPVDHPVIDVLVKEVLPILLPLLVNVLKKQSEQK